MSSEPSALNPDPDSLPQTGFRDLPLLCWAHLLNISQSSSSAQDITEFLKDTRGGGSETL